MKINIFTKCAVVGAIVSGLLGCAHNSSDEIQIKSLTLSSGGKKLRKFENKNSASPGTCVAIDYNDNILKFDKTLCAAVVLLNNKFEAEIRILNKKINESKRHIILISKVAGDTALISASSSELVRALSDNNKQMNELILKLSSDSSKNSTELQQTLDMLIVRYNSIIKRLDASVPNFKE